MREFCVVGTCYGRIQQHMSCLSGYACVPGFMWSSIWAAPSVSFTAELNGVATAGYSVTVSGMSFGFLDVTASNRVGLTSCSSTSWASASSVVCLLAAGDGPLNDLQVTVEGIIGTRTRIFSFDGELSCQEKRHVGSDCFLASSAAPVDS